MTLGRSPRPGVIGVFGVGKFLGILSDLLVPAIAMSGFVVHNKGVSNTNNTTGEIMSTLNIDTILSALNDYIGDNIWQDVILELDEFDGQANDTFDGDSSQFVVTWTTADGVAEQSMICFDEAAGEWYEGRESSDEIAIMVGKASAAADVRAAIVWAIDGMTASATDLGDKVVVVDAAVNAVLAGEVTPFRESGASGLRAVAMGVVMGGGSWWVSAAIDGAK